MKNNKLAIMAVLNSLGVLVYILLVATLLSNGEKLFASAAPDTVFAPIAMLLLLVFSAALTGFLILGKPLMLYLDGQKKEALKLLFYTGGWLFIFILASFITLIIMK